MGAQSEGRSPPFFARLLKEMQYTRCRKRLTTQAISLRNIALAFLSPDDAIVKKTLAGFTLLILVYSLLWLLRQTEAQPSARLRAELRDPSTGRALPGRFYLTDEQGNFKSPRAPSPTRRERSSTSSLMEASSCSWRPDGTASQRSVAPSSCRFPWPSGCLPVRSGRKRFR